MRMLGQGACSRADERLDAELCVTVPASPAAATALRRAVRALEGFFGSGKAGEVDLLVTELVTNGVKHANANGSNRITLGARVEDETLHIAVTDSGEGFKPEPRERDRSEPGGWGLVLVDGIADRWGVEDGPTTVWFELAGAGERMAAQNVDADRLKKIDVFSSLSDDELEKLAGYAEETSISEGEKLTKKGSHSYQLFGIEAGEVDVQRDGDTVATLGAGDVVGETGVVGRGLRNADVVAKGDVKAIYFTQDQVKRMRKEVPEVGDRLDQILEERDNQPGAVLRTLLGALA